MKLSDYLRQHDLTLADFAAQIGRSTATVSRVAREKNVPDAGTIRAIAAATGGKVTANDFFDLGSGEAA